MSLYEARSLSFQQVVTEVVVKNAVPWMEKQLQQLEAPQWICTVSVVSSASVILYYFLLETS